MLPEWLPERQVDAIGDTIRLWLLGPEGGAPSDLGYGPGALPPKVPIH